MLYSVKRSWKRSCSTSFSEDPMATVQLNWTAPCSLLRMQMLGTTPEM